MEDQEYLKKLGERIVELRNDSGLSQVQLANSIGMEDSSLRRIEKGRVNSTILMLRKIADGLNIPVQDLLPKED
jgi:transcriptional regulator with XRE-family HTH domain